MELRERIAREVFDARGSTEWSEEIGKRCGEAADRILALPEIAEALKFHADYKAWDRDRPRNVWQPVIPNA